MQYLDAAQSCQPRLLDRVHHWLRNAQRLWPSTCVLCRGQAQPLLDICAPCAGDLPRIAHGCPRCALPLQHTDPGTLCGRCQNHLPNFDASFVPYRYEYPVDHLIQRLKFGNHVACGRVCGTLFAQAWRARQYRTPELMIPVPLGSRRYRSRGYNQAHELARAISREVRIPVRTDLLARVRETTEQVGLKRKERRRNVRGAFEVTGDVSSKRVAIVDDVVTTGSTANEIARVLRRAGAEHIEVWAVARA
ncbi:MAG TPA: ComF family protein [Steroidobacteraceae bacterium]|nr:ComF family protein [Steroidobacteraceae bacterium]